MADTWHQISNVPPPIPGQLYGLTLSAAGSTATFGIAAGRATDSTAAQVMILGSAYTKTTSAWAVGSGNGALDTGTIAVNTWYYVHLIKRLDTGVVDILFSLSPTAPTLPTNYTIFRRIGSMRTDGSSHWIKFTQRGDSFLWAVGIGDVAALPLPFGTQVTATMSVPAVPVEIIINITMTKVIVGFAGLLVTGQDQSSEVDGTPSGNHTFFMDTTDQIAVSTGTQIVMSNNQKLYLSSASTGAISNVYIVTQGWKDNRGQTG